MLSVALNIAHFRGFDKRKKRRLRAAAQKEASGEASLRF